MTPILVASGFVAGILLWRALTPAFAEPAFVRTNYRGASLPTGAGIAIVVAALAVEGVVTLLETGWLDTPAADVAARRVVVLGALGFGLLGLLDDLAGSGESGGFRGHLGALARGRLTTGGIKLFGGGALALALVGMIEPGATGRLLLDAALVALMTNLANLFDRAPGRASKVALAGGAALLVAAWFPGRLAGTAVVLGAAGALLLPDLRERCMLGDAGANVLGAAIGLGIVLETEPSVRTAVLVVAAGLNVASELVSFSTVIDRVPPLRWIDRLGRSRGYPEVP